MSAARWWWCTAPAPGAIAVACAAGSERELDALARSLSGAPAPREGAVAWRAFGPGRSNEAPFDDGVVARVAHDALLLMPHAGPGLRRAMADALAAAGAVGVDAPCHAPARELLRATYPEACDDLEALMLATLSAAASPTAIDLLLKQPALWRAALAAGTAPREPQARDSQLAHLLAPARVVVTGPANAGKSTLLNALAGRAVAVVHAAPGTTRDAVAARIDLNGVVVDWFDTPGERRDADEIEAEAARMAAQLLGGADLVVHLTAPGLGWAGLRAAHGNRRAPGLRVLNKCDTIAAAACAEASGAELCISAQRGDGMAALVERVRGTLVPNAALAGTAPWWFSGALSSASLARP